MKGKPVSGLIGLRDFMALAKDLIESDSWHWNTDNVKNWDFRREFELTRPKMREMLLQLCRHSRIDGPEQDRDALTHGNGTVYEFVQAYRIGDPVQVVKVYVKLKIPEDRSELTVLSFHREAIY